MQSFDIVFLGGGPAGYTGAIKAARYGKKVLLVEKESIGGVCLNKGCIPAKSVISSLKVADDARRGEEFGLHIPTVDVRLAEIVRRKERIVSTSRMGVESLLKKRGVTVLQGRGRIAGEGLLDVTIEGEGESRFNVKNLVLCTGSIPASLPGVPTDNITKVNSDSLLTGEKMAGRLLIIGGGAIGCEYAYIFNRLGLSVTVCEVEDHLLPREDEEIGKSLEREFKKKKIPIITCDKVLGARTESQKVEVSFEKAGKMEFDKVLVSVGREPCTKGLGLEDAGIETSVGGVIKVNSKMQTSASWVYAAGDVAGRFQLAYTASREAATAVENIVGNSKEMMYDAVPRVIFTDPEVGCVGLTQSDALLKGFRVKTGTFHFRGLGRAHASGEIAGFAKIVADEKDDRVLGVHIIGAHASELVHSGCFIVGKKLTTREASDMLYAHPVFSEVIAEALWDVHGEAIHKL